ncbi:MAG: hypothetical protein US76_03850 [Parcubacteria group bacterium GW2011_GWA2_38_13b]|nr:MAG: hypothetical protein US76_03850 [Parcubacteria group bacterium GW2011_GWA2_38_13b]
MKKYKKYALGLLLITLSVSVFWWFSGSKNEGQNNANLLDATIAIFSGTRKNGYLRISVSKEIKSQNIIEGAVQATFADYILDARKSNEDVAVTGLPLWYSVYGKGAAIRFLTNCKLYDGNTNLMKSGIMIGEAKKDVLFQFSEKFVVPQRTIKTVTLRCDVVQSGSEKVSWGYDAKAANPVITGVTSGQDIKEKEKTSKGSIMTIVPDCQSEVCEKKL